MDEYSLDALAAAGFMVIAASYFIAGRPTLRVFLKIVFIIVWLLISVVAPLFTAAFTNFPKENYGAAFGCLIIAGLLFIPWWLIAVHNLRRTMIRYTKGIK